MKGFLKDYGGSAGFCSGPGGEMPRKMKREGGTW